MKKMAFVIAAAASFASAAEVLSPSTTVEKFDPAFNEYKAFEDVAVEGWRYANEEVGRLRGHMGHLNDDPSPLRLDGPSADPKKDSGSRR